MRRDGHFDIARGYIEEALSDQSEVGRQIRFAGRLDYPNQQLDDFAKEKRLAPADDHAFNRAPLCRKPLDACHPVICRTPAIQPKLGDSIF